MARIVTLKSVPAVEIDGEVYVNIKDLGMTVGRHYNGDKELVGTYAFDTSEVRQQAAELGIKVGDDE